MEFRPPPFQKSKNPISSIESGTSWQRQYYKDKFGFKKDQMENKPLEVVQHYIEGLCWMLHYYYKGVPSWDWYYQNYYPPLASTFSNFEDIHVDFNQKSEPLKPLEHMSATFPSKYAHPAVDAHGKRFEEQYIIKLPFVNEKRLYGALKSIDSTLIEEEEKRNRFDDERLFVYSTNPSYQEFDNMNTNNENEIALSENMKQQIIPEDAVPKMNNQVLCVKYRNGIT
ncbi:unnamed protein product [Adineta steineri]|nr:unnamed protein product [Adineta steineri]